MIVSGHDKPVSTYLKFDGGVENSTLTMVIIEI